jgi:hypothetical protein
MSRLTAHLIRVAGHGVTEQPSGVQSDGRAIHLSSPAPATPRPMARSYIPLATDPSLLPTRSSPRQRFTGSHRTAVMRQSPDNACGSSAGSRDCSRLAALEPHCWCSISCSRWVSIERR